MSPSIAVEQASRAILADHREAGPGSESSGARLGSSGRLRVPVLWFQGFDVQPTGLLLRHRGSETEQAVTQARL